MRVHEPNARTNYRRFTKTRILFDNIPREQPASEAPQFKIIGATGA
jgi:hypothetical protein